MLRCWKKKLFSISGAFRNASALFYELYYHRPIIIRSVVVSSGTKRFAIYPRLCDVIRMAVAQRPIKENVSIRQWERTNGRGEGIEQGCSYT